MKQTRLFDGFSPVACLAHDLHVPSFQETGEPIPKESMIVGQQHTHSPMLTRANQEYRPASVAYDAVSDTAQDDPPDPAAAGGGHDHEAIGKLMGQVD